VGFSHLLQINIVRLNYRNYLILFFWLCIALTFPCSGQHPVIHNFSDLDGLPSPTLYDLLQDDCGALWIGTDNGISRFDGVNFRNFGYEDGLNFWGGSTIFDPNGDLVVRAPDFEDSLTVSTIDLNQFHRTRARLPILRDERTSLVQRELERMLNNHE